MIILFQVKYNFKTDSNLNCINLLQILLIALAGQWVHFPGKSTAWIYYSPRNIPSCIEHLRMHYSSRLMNAKGVADTFDQEISPYVQIDTPMNTNKYCHFRSKNGKVIAEVFA